MRKQLFISAGRIAAALPSIRGKTRILLALYRLLRLDRERVRVRTRLRKPVSFDASLDLGAWAQRVAFLTGGYEADTVEFLLDLHQRDGRNGWLLDVGANVGLIAIPFAKASGVRVVAVEAVPDNVAALHENVRANALESSVSILSFALGASAGVAQIQVEGDLGPGEGTGTGSILPDGSTYDCVRQEIVVRTLEDVSELPPGCSIVKIDTDGHDLKVLQGGVRFLERERPVIFGEFSAHCLAWHEQSLRDVVAFARAVRYDVWLRVHPGWAFQPYEPDIAYGQDLLLVPQERRDRFRAMSV